MTVTITLDAETEKSILRKATRLGLTPSDYLLRLAEKSVKPEARSKHEQSLTKEEKPVSLTPVQAVALWREHATVGSYGDPTIDALDLARVLRRDAEDRQWEQSIPRNRSCWMQMF